MQNDNAKVPKLDAKNYKLSENEIPDSNINVSNQNFIYDLPNTYILGRCTHSSNTLKRNNIK